MENLNKILIFKVKKVKNIIFRNKMMMMKN